MKFNELSLAPELLKAIEEEGYTIPSPIQEGAIPPALLGRDVLGCAQTGTGKTAAFALPILQHLLDSKPDPNSQKRKIKALILTPTRELALQIAESFKAYGRHTIINTSVIFGGVGAQPQISELRQGVDVLIATPGRLCDLYNQKEIDLRFVETFVLDEADRMLDMGFVHDVKRIITFIPEKRQTLFFSATMPPEITDLVAKLLKNPAEVAVTPISSTVDTIEQSVYFVDKGNKIHLLKHLLDSKNVTSALVFTRTKHGADRVVKELLRSKISAAAIHGNKSQGARVSALDSFKDGRILVLVATDIAARGIDIDQLSHVFNYDLPNIPETYVHRIGRTGRAGLEGISISFCDIEEKPYLADIEKLIKKNVPVVENHPFPMQIFIAPPKAEPQQRPQRREMLPQRLREERLENNRNFHGNERGGKPSGSKAPQKRGYVKKG